MSRFFVDLFLYAYGVRIIAHLDMDAFFASIEERDHPRYRGKPLVVGADPEEGRGRGIVSTANYAARKFGIHSAMPISTAWRLAEKARLAGAPRTIFVGGHYRNYSATSARLIAIVRHIVPLVEQASVDEAYLDLSFAKTYAWAEKIALKIKVEIKKKEKLTCSIGIGPNKLIAKIAVGMHKPDGLTVVPEKDAETFLEPLPIRTIPGVGPKTESVFGVRGIRTVKDLKRFSRSELSDWLGKWGYVLYDRIRGRDDSPVVEEYEVKSIGEQTTFREDTRDASLVTEEMKALCASVIRSFLQSDFRSFRTVSITVRFEDFETKTRAHTLSETKDKIGNLFEQQSPKKLTEFLQFEAMKLLAPFFDTRENPRRKKIRLVGVRIEKLV